MIKYFLEKKVTSIMLYLALLLLGSISLKNLKVELLPDISYPTLTAVTVYENVAPAEIETLITRPIEEIISSVSGVDRVTSDSIEGVSIVRVRFRWGTDMDQASIQLREKVDLVKGTLPLEAKKTIVLRFDPNDSPIMQIAIIPKNIKLENIRAYLKKNIIPLIEKIDGVAAITVSGGYERQIRVEVDKGKLEAYNVSVNQLIQSISSNNFNYPAGNTRNGDKELLIRTAGAFKSVNAIGSTVLGLTKSGLPIYLENIAQIYDSYREKTSSSYLNGNEIVSLTLKKESGKNTIAVAANLREAIEELNSKFSQDILFEIISDQSIFVEEAVSSVSNAGIQASFICFFILLFFLGSWKEPLLVVIAIPISVTMTFILMYFQKLSLNTMSLGGLAVGVGMVVDSGTVVLESIYEKHKIIKDKFKACLEGTIEVTPSVISSTLTSIVVFLPILFVDGIAGAIFKEFALTITYSLISSCIVSLTLIPVLFSSSFFTRKENSNSTMPKFEKLSKMRFSILENLTYYYERLLLIAFEQKNILMISVAIILPLTVALFWAIPKELMPDVDRKELNVKVIASPGTRLIDTSDISSKLSQIFSETEEVQINFSKVGYEDKDIIVNPKSDFGLNRSEFFVKLSNEVSNSNAFIDSISPKVDSLADSTGAKISILPTKSILADILSSTSSDLTIEVTGDKLELLKEITIEIESKLKSLNKFTTITNSFQEEVPEFQVLLDRDKMGFYGLSVQEVATALKASIKGEIATKYREMDTEIGILVRLKEEDRTGIEALKSILIQSEKGFNLKLNSLARVELKKTNKKIQRFDSKRVGIISISIGEMKYSEAVSIINPILEDYHEKKDISVLFGDIDKEINKSLQSLSYASILAIILVYMVLASQFENLILPVLIMTSIFISGIGSAFGLILTGNSLNIISMMGIVMLSGIVVNNAILLVESFKFGDNSKINLIQNIVQVCKRRLQPILNTTLTTILGMLPMLITFGSSSPQAPMAAALIGGLLISTCLTLFLIPVGYHLITIRK